MQNKLASAEFYPDHLLLGEALQLYFSKYHFENGGYDKKWFHIKLGFVYIPFPNTKARVEAVKRHDIHHVLTNYSAHWKGETEIGAWELASGCGKYYVAWVLNCGSLIVGMFLWPKFVYRAFVRGRSTRTNYYKKTVKPDAMSGRTLGELRREIGISATDSVSS
jgi:hypothetical protein